jgi:CheY-like chemotaxis protein
MSEEKANTRVEQEVQHALQYLYDPTELRKNGLLALLGIDTGPSPLTQLRRTLAEAIEALKPDSHVPADAIAWRVYHILTYRYLERLSQKETAADLTLSVRQLRRNEHAAIRVLAHALKNRYGSSAALAGVGVKEETNQAEHQIPTARGSELAWLQQTFPSETVTFQVLIESVLQTAAPLIKAYDVSISIEVPPDVPPMRGQLATLRQAVLSILSMAVPAATGGTGVIHINTNDIETSLNLCFWREDGTFVQIDEQMLESLTISRELVELGGGTLDSQSRGQRCSITLTLPNAITRRIPILVVDDNEDTLQLFNRYLATTLFEVTNISDPTQALTTATQIQPQAIVVDVMLPGIDGWELLGRFREHPEIQNVPVIVCTILPQEKLALALGAAAFLQKPFTRESLLNLLAHLTSPTNSKQ